jgi:hypothetical protein
MPPIAHSLPLPEAAPLRAVTASDGTAGALDASRQRWHRSDVDIERMRADWSDARVAFELALVSHAE